MDTLLYLSIPVTLEAFEADALEAHPGRCLLDRFGNHVQMVEFDSKEEDVNILCILDAELDRAIALDDCVVVATDALVGCDRAFQAVSAAWVWSGGVPIKQSCQAAGRVTASDVELHAIHMGIFTTCAVEGACHVVLFTDHPASARWAVDLSVSSGQAQALLVRSSLEWPLHHLVHCYVTNPNYQVPVGERPYTTLNYLYTAEAQACHDSWTREFMSTSSSRRDFLHLKKGGKHITPTYLSGGLWLLDLHDSQLCVHVCWAVLNHAPIRDFRVHFKISADGSCPCGAAQQTHEHVLTDCPNFGAPRHFPKCWWTLVNFCKENPRAFSFDHLPGG
ncbi:hypothetical protein AN958_09791 [Leucoagaricus sp. SymC.cos]|nr:hypothetical protein AN958_09791 [Leucoagaricus sp. SymC.cos]